MSRALIPTPDDPALGLNESEIKFVYAFVETGSVAAAERQAGYSKKYGHEVMRRPKISAAILFESQRRLTHGAPIAVTTLLALCRGADSEKVRLDAAKFLIEHNLGKALERIQIEFSIPQEEKELLARIDELSQELGLHKRPMIDITSEVVEEPPTALGAPGDD